MLDPVDKIPDARKAEPERLDAGLAVPFPGEEAAEHGDSPDHLAQCRSGLRDGFLGQDVRAFPLFISEEQRGLEFGMRSAQSDQACQSPRYDDRTTALSTFLINTFVPSK